MCSSNKSGFKLQVLLQVITAYQLKSTSLHHVFNLLFYEVFRSHAFQAVPSKSRLLSFAMPRPERDFVDTSTGRPGTTLKGCRMPEGKIVQDIMLHDTIIPGPSFLRCFEHSSHISE